MAGAGFRTFVDGDVLTAAQVNTYLMEQAVMVFATATARTTALPTPSEGMVSYLADTNVLEVYTGAAWVSLDDPNAIQNSIVDAKGDLIVATAADTPARLAVGTNEHRLVADSAQTAGLKYVADTTNYAIAAKGDLLVGTAADTLTNVGVGTNGQVLTADSAQTAGVKWAAAAAGGKVLQVVQGDTTTQTTISSASYTDTGLSASITPSAATSKVLVIAHQMFAIDRGTSTNRAGLQLFRGATMILDQGGTVGGTALGLIASGTTALTIYMAIPSVYLDSPNTTSSTTYKLQARVETTANSAAVVTQINSTRSVITLVEIGA
jgi:hypothetical protein